MLSGVLLSLVLAHPGLQMPSVSAEPRLASVFTYVPQRVYDTRRNTFTDFEAMLADLSRADVVLIGEQHDNPNSHQLETALLEGLARRHVPVTLSLEMFERDVQPAIDRYLAGTAAEDEFLQGARPWPRYATDYRPLVEIAKAQRWGVVAANVPRHIAADVAKSGKSAVDALASGERHLAASDLQCPHDAYFDRFADQMGGHAGQASSPAVPDAATDRYFWAQCVKDETMAESIAEAFSRQSGHPGVVVHVTGAFHSDYGGGIAERVRRRLERRRVALVSLIPAGDLDSLAPGEDDLKRADYLVYTTR